MDFLSHNDGRINIRKQCLRTNKGKLKLLKQNSEICACIQIAETTIIHPNSETFIKCKIEQSYIRNELISIAEPTKCLTNKGCFIARTLVSFPNMKILLCLS